MNHTNITFFIGNGFDLRQGLHTKYEDFYQHFINHAAEENLIRTWMLEDDALKNPKRWADLELQLGEQLRRLSEDQLDAFTSAKEELEVLLLEYLEKEQSRFNAQENEKAIAGEMRRSLTSFASSLPAQHRQSIEETLKANAIHVRRYCFVIFNYTQVLDQILEATKKHREPVAQHSSTNGMRDDKLGELIHVHGTLRKDMILGVNDKTQVNNERLKANDEFLDLFVKPRVNTAIGEGKTESVQEVIDKSCIICIFGMSLGATDKLWWERILQWLTRSETNKLVLFQKPDQDTRGRSTASNQIQRTRLAKDRLFEIGGAELKEQERENVSDRIFVSLETDIFNFSEFVTEDLKEKE